MAEDNKQGAPRGYGEVFKDSTDTFSIFDDKGATLFHDRFQLNMPTFICALSFECTKNWESNYLNNDVMF